MSTSSRSQSWLFALSGAVLAAVVILGVYLFTSPDTDPASDDTGDDAAGSPSASPTAEDTATAEPTPTEDDDEGGGETVAVPAYFVVDTEKAGPRLVREFHQVGADDQLEDAVDLVLSGAADDPDYRTLWPGGGVEDVTFDGVGSDGVVTVELEDDGWTTPAEGMDEVAAERALQQVVYTVQGVVQARPRVEFVLGGQPATVFGIDTTGGVTQASPLEVLNLVNVTEPAEGTQVEGATLAAVGVANSFEATVLWEVRDSSGEAVLSGHATAEGWMEDRLFPWEVEIDLADLSPGDYVFFASTDDASGGEEGFGAFTDDKAFTLR